MEETARPGVQEAAVQMGLSCCCLAGGSLTGKRPWSVTQGSLSQHLPYGSLEISSIFRLNGLKKNHNKICTSKLMNLFPRHYLIGPF